MCVCERDKERVFIKERKVYSTHTQKLCNQKLDIILILKTSTNFKFQFPPAGSPPPLFPFLQILLPKFPIYFYAQNTSSLFIILSPANFALRVSIQFSKREFWGQVLA